MAGNDHMPGPWSWMEWTVWTRWTGPQGKRCLTMDAAAAQHLCDLLRQFIAVLARELQQADIRIGLDLLDEAGPLLSDRGQEGPMRLQQPAHGCDESLGKTLHLADFVDYEQLDVRRTRIEDGQDLLLKPAHIDPILAHPMGAFDVDMGQDAGAAVKATPAKTLTRARFANLLRVEAGNSRLCSSESTIFLTAVVLPHPGGPVSRILIGSPGIFRGLA